MKRNRESIISIFIRHVAVFLHYFSAFNTYEYFVSNTFDNPNYILKFDLRYLFFFSRNILSLRIIKSTYDVKNLLKTCFYSRNDDVFYLVFFVIQ